MHQCVLYLQAELYVNCTAGARTHVSRNDVVAVASAWSTSRISLVYVTSCISLDYVTSRISLVYVTSRISLVYVTSRISVVYVTSRISLVCGIMKPGSTIVVVNYVHK